MDIKKFDLNKIGEEIAAEWGGHLINFKIDSNKQMVNFFCIEDDEQFITQLTFKQIAEFFKNYIKE